MNIDDIVKLILALAISGSLIAISWQISRLIGKLADSIQDLRHAIQNISNASDMVLEDYGELRKVLRVLIDIIQNFEENILSPLRVVTGIVQKFSGNQTQETKEEDL